MLGEGGVLAIAVGGGQNERRRKLECIGLERNLKKHSLPRMSGPRKVRVRSGSGLVGEQWGAWKSLSSQHRALAANDAQSAFSQRANTSS